VQYTVQLDHRRVQTVTPET